MTPIRVALCITDLDLGGAERCLTQLAIRMDRNRFQPTVYCLGPRPDRAEASCVPTLEDAGVEVHCLGGQTIWQFPAVLRRLRQLLTSHNTQLLQTFMFHANVLGRMAARGAGVRATLSGIRVSERQSHWHLWLDRMTRRRVDRWVCVSRSVADFSIAHGLPSDKIVVIPNGIDLECYPAEPADLAALGVPADRRVVTFVGRLESQKGVRWLIETAPAWLAGLPECDLLVVGDGPLRGHLQNACRDLGIANRVHFAGWRPNVPEILAASSLLVLPSLWEGMPNVVLEAMASRMPVVATDVEGVVELLGPDASLQTVHYGDTEAFVAKVVSLMRDELLATAMGEKNRRRAEENFTISTMVSAYEDLWESLVTS